jgi:hypothetical protein
VSGVRKLLSTRNVLPVKLLPTIVWAAIGEATTTAKTAQRQAGRNMEWTSTWLRGCLESSGIRENSVLGAAEFSRIPLH